MQSMTIKSTPCQVAPLAQWLQQLLAEQYVEQSTASRLELLLVEAVNNVIEHGYCGIANHEINVAVATHSDRIVLTIVDRGKPPPAAETYSSADLPDPDCLPESGWGVGLINIIADQIQVTRHSGVNTTVLTKHVDLSDTLQRGKTGAEA